MYGKCNSLDQSRWVFDEMLDRDVVSYNALIGAHARLGEDMSQAQRVFDHMPVRNAISWNGMIVGYVNGGDLSSARRIFDKMPERNVVSWTTMLVGYAKSGYMDSARFLFDSIPERNIIAWTAMIKPEAVTMTGVISASAQLGGTELANWIGSYVDREGIERNEKILTALIDMHAKCGNMEEACRLFRGIPSPDVFSYSALITGLASHGQALEIFQKMQAEGIDPDNITFMGVLTACSHTRHFACMVDMLARAGRLDEAHEMVMSMPEGRHPGALGALLSACKTYGNVEIAESTAKKLITGQWEEAAKVRVAMKEKRIDKLPGCSWIEVKSRNHCHEFS
ncbi:hypothetical protein MKW92_052887 [Papaver armeniacum]|nr:hypothetical protein MKW92_052887 [Papaver armeniacum]